MKKLFFKLALVFTIVSIASISTSCRDDDEESCDKPVKECTYYIDTTYFKVDKGAPFTKEQLAKEYSDALYEGCEGDSISDEILLNIIQATYKNQTLKGWTQYVHGSTYIMCHIKSINEDALMYRY